MTKVLTKPETRREMTADVHCYMCTHNVQALVLVDRRTATVKPGQKCSRCSSAIDSGYVLRLHRQAVSA